MAVIHLICVNFLMIQSALLSTVPRCLSDLCHALNVTLRCSYTPSTGTVLILLMETCYRTTDIYIKVACIT